MADDQTPTQPGATTENPSDTPTETPGGTPTPDAGDAGGEAAESTTAPRKKAAARKRPAKKAAPAEQPPPSEDAAPSEAAAQETGSGDQPPVDKPVVKRTTRKRTTKKAAPAPAEGDTPSGAAPSADAAVAADADGADPSGQSDGRPTPPTVLFQPPPATPAPARRKKPATTEDETDAAGGSADDATGSETGDTGDKRQGGARQGAKPGKGKTQAKGQGSKPKTGPDSADEADDDQSPERDDDEGAEQDDESQDGQDESGSDDGAPRRRRRRGGRRRRGKGGQDGDGNAQDDDDDNDSGSDSDGGDSDSGDADDSDGGDDSDQSPSSSSRRRRRRRRSGDADDPSDGSDASGTKVRSARAAEDEITSFTGSTRLEAKKQRRREGREAGRRRAPVISEAEFLARRESVNRKMVVRQRDDLTQIAVMEDKVLVEHYVARESQTSLIGNVYLGRVQNVLPSMEAAFIDIGRGRNAVLYAGEVNWDALGAGGGGGKERKIEQVLKPGQSVLVQVSKDPIGHKGARLTSQISLPGRFLVYVPEGNTSGISRKLPDTERNRLKNLLKEIVPSEAGVIVRTAAEGAAEEELRRDVARLTARWEDIKGKVEGGNAPQELYSEPDLTLKVVRDLFTEDIGELVVSGADAWDMVSTYVDQVAPDLAERLTQHDDSENDAFAAYRIDEQIAKALERKVWLPSGGSLIIDRTEAMTVVDVNTGKFTGSGGNLEETVTKNNLEAAEEIVRQLRLRDIGGIIVIDFIDMVLESNRDLVLRRLIECLGRDRTRHQVAEVTSLGLVQMTRKRIGTGLLEAFSEQCEHCQGRGYHVHAEPVEQKKRGQEDDSRRGRRGRRGKSEEQDGSSSGNGGNDRNARKGKDARSGGTADNGSNGGNGSNNGNGDGDHGDNGVRRPTPAEFAAMAHRQAEADAADDNTAAATQSAEQDGADASAGDGPKQPEQAEQPQQADQAEQPQQPEQPQPSGQAEQPQQPEQAEQPPVPEGPRIVTSTRRRGARRAAGPPRGEVSESPT